MDRQGNNSLKKDKQRFPTHAKQKRRVLADHASKSTPDIQNSFPRKGKAEQTKIKSQGVKSFFVLHFQAGRFRICFQVLPSVVQLMFPAFLFVGLFLASAALCCPSFSSLAFSVSLSVYILLPVSLFCCGLCFAVVSSTPSSCT